MKCTYSFTAIIKRILVLFLIMMLTAGCTNTAQFTWSNAGALPAAATPPLPGELSLTVFMPLQSGVFNPLTNRSREMRNLMGLVYEGLLRFDADMKPASCLAESWVTEEDGALLITLRKGIVFSDGTPLTAKDVTATIDAIKKAGPTGVYGYILPYIKTWEAVSDLELRVRGSVAAPMFLYALTFPILPESADMTGAELPGTGPMVVQQYTEGQQLVLGRNADWWRKAPIVKEIKAVALQDDVTAINSFAMGRLDMLSTRRANATQTLSASAYRSYTVSTRRFEFLALNLHNPELADVRMRRAIQQAVDRKEIIDSIFLGHAVIADTPILPGSALMDQRVAAAEYAPDEALAAITSLGFIFDQQNGQLLRGNAGGAFIDQDAAVSYTLIYNEDLDNNERQETAQHIAAGLKKIGIGIVLKELKYTDYETALRDGDYDMALASFETSPIPDLTFCYGSGVNDNVNIMYYASEDMDRLLSAARTAQDEDTLKTSMSSIAELAGADLPFIGLFFRTGTLLALPEISGIGRVQEDTIYANIGEWAIDQNYLP